MNKVFGRESATERHHGEKSYAYDIVNVDGLRCIAVDECNRFNRCSIDCQ